MAWACSSKLDWSSLKVIIWASSQSDLSFTMTKSWSLPSTCSGFRLALDLKGYFGCSWEALISYYGFQNFSPNQPLPAVYSLPANPARLRSPVEFPPCSIKRISPCRASYDFWRDVSWANWSKGTLSSKFPEDTYIAFIPAKMWTRAYGLLVYLSVLLQVRRACELLFAVSASVWLNASMNSFMSYQIGGLRLRDLLG